jgi:hypothetical protein
MRINTQVTAQRLDNPLVVDSQEWIFEYASHHGHVSPGRCGTQLLEYDRVNFFWKKTIAAGK